MNILTTIYYGIDSNYVLHIAGTPTSVTTNSFNDTTSRTSAPWTAIISHINSIGTVQFDNAVSPSNTSYWFADFKYLDTFNNWVYLNVSNVTDMSYMFKNCGTYHLQLVNGQPTVTTSQLNLDFSNWNVSNVTNMSHMFENCGGSSNVFVPDLEDWNTSNVTDMSYMFKNCWNACKIMFTFWDVHNVINMSGMFYNVYRADNQRISGNTNFYHPRVLNWVTTNLKYTNEMFYECSFGGFNPDVSNWDMSNVLTADYMFYKCSGASFNPDFNKWKLPKVTSLSYMFAQCNGANFCPNVANWHVARDTVLSMAVEMFAGCSGNSFTKLKLNTWNVDYRATITNMFSGCSKLKTIYCNNNWGNTSIGVFSGCNLLRGPYHSANSGSYTMGTYARPDTEDQMGRFIGNTGICWGYETGVLYLSQDLSDSNTPFSFHEEEVLDEKNIPWYDNRTNIAMVQIDGDIYPQSIAFWFSGCQSCNDVDNWSGLHTSYVTNMNSAFKNCASFNENVSNWDTSNVTDMSFMFYHCTDQDFNPDVSNWDTSKVTTLQSMFDGCTGNNFNPNFSNWDTSSVTTTEGMFYNCKGNSFNPDLVDWDTSNVTNTRYMFAYNSGTSFNPNVSNWNVSNLVNTEYMFRNCSGLTKLDLHNWNPTALEISSYMFYNCTNLKTIYCNYTWSATSSTSMFQNCSNLVGQNGTSYNGTYINIAYAKLDESGSPGYFTKWAIPIDANHLHFSTGGGVPAGRMQIVDGYGLYYREENLNTTEVAEGWINFFDTTNRQSLIDMVFIQWAGDSDPQIFFENVLDEIGWYGVPYNETSNWSLTAYPAAATPYISYSFFADPDDIDGMIYLKPKKIISQTSSVVSGSWYDVQEFSTCSHTYTSSRTYFFDYCEGAGSWACDADCNCGCEAYICYDCGGIYPIAGHSCECGDDWTNYLNTWIDPTTLPHASVQLPTTALAPYTLRQTQIAGLYSESYGYVYNNWTEYLANKSQNFIEVPHQIKDPLNAWPTLLDLLYPIGTYVLWDNKNLTPIEKFGGVWTNLSSTYNNRYLALGGPCMSATSGGSDLSSISYTPAGSVASVTLKPADCSVPSGTALSSYGNIGTKTYTSTSFAYSHSHTFAKPVCKSVSAGTGSPVAYRTTAISGTSTYIEATSANWATYKLGHQAMSVANTWLTYTNAHNHSVPAIAAANAASGHTHTFTGTAQTLNLSPLAKCVQIWRRDG